MTEMDNVSVKIDVLGVEANTIMVCLAKEPYGEVFTLIPEIRSQAQMQVDAAKPADPNAHRFVLTLTGRDIKKIVSTLNKHPFDQVVQLVENIRTQVIPQLEAATKPEGKEAA